jgi:DNA replication protein DnaC
MSPIEAAEDLKVRMNAAQIPEFYRHYTLYNFPRKDSSALRACAEYAAQGRISGNLMLYGPFGTGKTSLAVSILDERLTTRGERGLFQVVPMLFEEIKASFGREDQSAVLQRVMNVHLLVLDDLGAERATEWVQGQLYTILNHRLIHSKPTIVTTNLDTHELADSLGQRTVERLKSYRVIHVGGGNLRDERRDD